MFLRKMILIVCFSLPGFANADWHGGKVTELYVNYDQGVNLKIEGWSRNNCTCYPGWPSTMCLDSNRETKDFERSVLLASRARGTKVHVHIDEASCMVTAMYEVNE